MRAAIASLIDSLPAVSSIHGLVSASSSNLPSRQISDMKKHLEKKVGRGEAKPKLSSMDPAILPAAWTVLRWCVFIVIGCFVADVFGGSVRRCIGSCTAHLEELKQPEDMVQNIGELILGFDLGLIFRFLLRRFFLAPVQI